MNEFAFGFNDTGSVSNSVRALISASLVTKAGPQTDEGTCAVLKLNNGWNNLSIRGTGEMSNDSRSAVVLPTS